MKPTHDPRRELLEDVFSPSSEGDSLAIEEVLGVLRRERRMRARGRGLAALGACAILAAFSHVWLSRPEKSEPALPLITAKTVAMSQPDAPKVERVSDEGALAMLDSTPSAVIEWPDGRRTLMIVVSNRSRAATPSEVER